MSTTFTVDIGSDEPVDVAYRTTEGIVWVNRLAHMLPDAVRVIPLDNTAQGIHTVGDLRKEIQRRKQNEINIHRSKRANQRDRSI